MTRLEGGGTPTTVTWAPDEGCFRLHTGGPDGDVVDEECGPGLPAPAVLRPGCWARSTVRGHDHTGQTITSVTFDR